MEPRAPGRKQQECQKKWKQEAFYTGLQSKKIRVGPGQLGGAEPKRKGTGSRGVGKTDQSKGKAERTRVKKNCKYAPKPNKGKFVRR